MNESYLRWLNRTIMVDLILILFNNIQSIYFEHFIWIQRNQNVADKSLNRNKFWN